MLLIEAFVLAYVVSEVASGHQVNQKIEVLAVVEGSHHIGNKRMGESGQQLAFILDTLHTFLHYYDSFGHLLHCVELVGLSVLHFPDLSISSLAYDLDKIEVCLAEALLPVQ